MPRSPLEKEIELLFQKHEAVVRNHFLVKAHHWNSYTVISQ